MLHAGAKHSSCEAAEFEELCDVDATHHCDRGAWSRLESVTGVKGYGRQEDLAERSGRPESCWAQTATETQVTALDTRLKYSRRAYVLQLFPVYNTGDCPVCAVGYKSEPPTIVGHGRLLTIQLYTERSLVPRGLSLHLSTIYVGSTRPLLLFAIVSWKTKDARMTQS